MREDYFVVADYDQEAITDIEITIRFDRIWRSIKRFFAYFFTNRIEIVPAHYVNIYTISENGAKKLDKLPDDIMIFVSRKL